VATHPAERGPYGLIPSPVELLGVRIHPVSAEQLVDLIIRWGHESAQRRISYANVHAMNLAFDDDAFRSALNSADLVFCDGYGVKGQRCHGLRGGSEVSLPRHGVQNAALRRELTSAADAAIFGTRSVRQPRSGRSSRSKQLPGKTMRVEARQPCKTVGRAVHFCEPAAAFC
jgi:hypothetical protein